MTPLAIHVAGCHVSSDGYPNVKYRLRALEQDAAYQIVRSDFPANARIRYGSRTTVALSALRACISLAWCSFAAVALIVYRRHLPVLYVPYPAIPVLWLLSWLPRRLRNGRIVADVFISWYDTVVSDRVLVSEESWGARALAALERRALLQTDLCLVDTRENAEHYARQLGLPRDRFREIPLHTGFDAIVPTPYRVRANERFQVVYIGTMVPLHGVDVLCDATEQLDPDLPIDIHLFGDGQSRESVDATRASIDARQRSGGVRFRWSREWRRGDELSRIAENADLCIGVLGSTDKARRVWPYKNYLYLACGRALVSGRGPVSDRLASVGIDAPFFVVPPGNAKALADLLGSLVHDRERVAATARFARCLFDQELSDRTIAARLDGALRG